MPDISLVSRIVHASWLAAPPVDVSSAWWRALDPRFAFQPEAFSLAVRDRALVSATAVVDLAARTLAATSLGVLALPLGYHPGKLRELRGIQDGYRRLADAGDADAFFRPPVSPPVVSRRPAKRTRFRPNDGECEDLYFQSAFVPACAALRPSWGRLGRNNVAHARIWRHRDRPRPTVLAIHGFGADQSWVNEFIFALPRFYGVGCDVMLVTLPFHGPRQERRSPFSGHGFFAGGVAHINEAFGQAVHDCRVFIDHLLEQRHVPAVGVTGISLGGCTAGLLAAVEERLAFVIPNVPVVTLADLMLEWRPLDTALRALLAASGMGLADLRHILAPCSPLTWAPRVPRERLMIVAGAGDRMAPPKHSRLLWERWGRCRLHWFPGSHLLHLDRGEYNAGIERFMGEVGFLPDPDQPSRAPNPI